MHCNFLSCGSVSNESFIASPVTETLRIIAQSTSLICVNTFILISGWFGIKRNERGLFHFFLQILFVSVVCLILSWWQGWLSLDSIRDFSAYWFIVAYLGLYILSPVINSYLDIANKKDIQVTIFSYGILCLLCGWLQDVASFHRGFSFAHFIWLYLLAGYMQRYSFPFKYKSLYFWSILFIIFVLINSFFYFGCLKINKEYLFLLWPQYINPLVIASSISFFLIFANLKIQSKFINFLGSSAFTIYLFHTNGFIWKHFISIAHSIYIGFNGAECIAIMFLFIFLIVVISILLNCLFQYAYTFLYKFNWNTRWH